MRCTFEDCKNDADDRPEGDCAAISSPDGKIRVGICEGCAALVESLTSRGYRFSFGFEGGIMVIEGDAQNGVISGGGFRIRRVPPIASAPSPCGLEK